VEIAVIGQSARRYMKQSENAVDKNSIGVVTLAPRLWCSIILNEDNIVNV